MYGLNISLNGHIDTVFVSFHIRM